MPSRQRARFTKHVNWPSKLVKYKDCNKTKLITLHAGMILIHSKHGLKFNLNSFLEGVIYEIKTPMSNISRVFVIFAISFNGKKYEGIFPTLRYFTHTLL
jgi:hypothetical protein